MSVDRGIYGIEVGARAVGKLPQDGRQYKRSIYRQNEDAQTYIFKGVIKSYCKSFILLLEYAMYYITKNIYYVL